MLVEGQWKDGFKALISSPVVNNGTSFEDLIVWQRQQSVTGIA